MRVLLINPPVKKAIVRDMAGGLGFRSDELLPPIDLGILAATLRNEKNEVSIIDSAVSHYNVSAVFNSVKSFKPDVIIANISLPTLRSDCDFLRKLKETGSPRVIAKTTITYQPIIKEILLSTSADFCITGEVDLSIGNVIQGKSKEGIAVLENQMLHEALPLFVDNLDLLPIAARDLLPNDHYKYILLGQKVTTMQTSRGCPFPCAYYCPYPLVQGKKWRAQSPERVFAEIIHIVKNDAIDKILFRDAVFTFDRARVNQICDLIIKEKLQFQWWCETRFDRLDEDLLIKMKEAGCQGVNVGIETGDSSVREQLAKSGLSEDKIKHIVRIARENNIKLHCLFMVGLPGETRKSLYETFNFIRQITHDSVGITLVTPYPGTLLFEEAKRKAWIEADAWEKYDGQLPVMHTDSLPATDLKFAQKMLYKGFYLSNRSSFFHKIQSKILNSYFCAWKNK